MAWTLEQWFAARDQVRTVYLEELGRDVITDDQALTTWLYHLREFGHDLAWLRATIRESDEWRAKHGGPAPPAPSSPGPPPPGPPPTSAPVRPASPQSGGGFLEHAGSTAVRPRLTRADMAAFIPDRGPFIVPGYGARMIRLTNASDGVVRPVGMTYWPIVNNHAGRSEMSVLLSLNDTLTLFTVNTGTGEILGRGELPFHTTGEGVYWSFSDPDVCYVPEGNRLTWFNVATRSSGTAFEAPSEVRQLHTSFDGQTHSMTLDGAAAVWKNGELRRFPSRGGYDECQIDKSGRWLVIKEGQDENRIVDLQAGGETTLRNADGAVGHSDMGFGYMVGEDDQTQPGGVFRRWTFHDHGRVEDAGVVYHVGGWAGMTRYVSHCDARPDGNQMVLFSSAHRDDLPRANEIVVGRLDGSLVCRAICPNLTDLDASGGGEPYWRHPRASLDPVGLFAGFTANCGTDRLDAFLVQVPGEPDR